MGFLVSQRGILLEIYEGMFGTKVKVPPFSTADASGGAANPVILACLRASMLDSWLFCAILERRGLFDIDKNTRPGKKCKGIIKSVKV